MSSRTCKKKYDESQIDCLIVSHPDLDHISSIDRFLKALGNPKVLLCNYSLKEEDFSGDSKVKETLLSLVSKYNTPAKQSPLSSENNGGVEFLNLYNNRENVLDVNDSSVFVMCKYMGQSFIFPGDISDKGWKTLWNNNQDIISNFIKNTTVILTAPHHGRKVVIL